jgi:hypothetical protein
METHSRSETLTSFRIPDDGQIPVNLYSNTPPSPSSGKYTVTDAIKEFEYKYIIYKYILACCLLHASFFIGLLFSPED